MIPILDLRPVRPGRYVYSLRAPGQPGHVQPNFFDSLEACLHDAACGLLHYFEWVELQVGGRSAGLCRVSRLLMEPERVAAALAAGPRRRTAPPAAPSRARGRDVPPQPQTLA